MVLGESRGRAQHQSIGRKLGNPYTDGKFWCGAVCARKCVGAGSEHQASPRGSRLIPCFFAGLTKVRGWTRTGGFWIEVPGGSPASKEIPG